MNIWHYYPHTGELIDQGKADPDPLVPGNWLIPAHSTTLEPPTFVDGYARVFCGNVWTLVEDHRGEVWWTAEGQRIEITDLGDSRSKGLLASEPPNHQTNPIESKPTPVSPRQIRLALSRIGLRQTVEDWVKTQSIEVQDSWYYSADFQRDHPLIVQCMQALGKTETELDDLFTMAAQL